MATFMFFLFVLFFPFLLISIMLKANEFMNSVEKENIRELACEYVKISEETTKTKMVNEQDDVKSVEEYNKKRKETLEKMFPQAYNTKKREIE